MCLLDQLDTVCMTAGPNVLWAVMFLNVELDLGTPSYRQLSERVPV